MKKPNEGPYQVRIDPQLRRGWAAWCRATGRVQGREVEKALRAYMVDETKFSGLRMKLRGSGMEDR